MIAAIPEVFLRMIGAPPGGDGSISSASLTFHPVIPTVLLVFLAVALIAASFWSYRDPTRPRHLLMASLRGLLFTLLIILLARPSLDLDIEKQSRRTLIGLIDTSTSFGVSDDGKTTRLENVVELLTTSPLISNLEKDVDVALYGFDTTTTEFDLEKQPTGSATALGNSLRQIANRRLGEPLAGIFLATDGVNTTGENPQQAARLLASADIPLYIYGVGSTEIPDLAIESVDVASTTLIGDDVPATVRIQSRGMEGKTATVSLTLAGTEATEKRVTFGSDGIVEIPLAFLPKQAGDFELVATITGGAAETLLQNNVWTRNLRVLDSRIRVLMVEQSSRWEFKYIQAMLLREQRVELDCLVIEADPEITRSPGSPYIASFPPRREDLYKYDLILFGDIDPKNLTNTQLENLTAYVSEAGGSLAILSGKRFTPHAYRFTPLASLLPIEAGPENPAPATRPIQLAPTSEGLESSALQLEATADASRARWSSLPPVYWTAAVTRAKPAAQILLTDPLNGKPVLALQRYGAGEVLFLGTDNTWRWRKNIGDLYHSTFWGQLVQRLAGTRLLAGSRRSQLRTDRLTYAPGERVTVYAKLSDASWQPIAEETVRAILTDTQESSREVLLHAVPEEPGRYRAEFTAPEVGRYRLAIASDPDSPIDLTVRTPDTELRNPTLDESLLRELAENTGGEYFTSDTIQSLPSVLKNKTVTQVTPLRAQLWSSPLMFLLIIATITTEWVLRKFAQLK